MADVGNILAIQKMKFAWFEKMTSQPTWAETAMDVMRKT